MRRKKREKVSMYGQPNAGGHYGGVKAVEGDELGLVVALGDG
jgi:hypothetical protein